MMAKKTMTMLFFCVLTNLSIAMEPNYPSARIITNPSLGQKLTTTIQPNGPGFLSEEEFGPRILSKEELEPEVLSKEESPEVLSKEEFWMRNGTLINMYEKRDFSHFKSGIEFYGIGPNCDTNDERIAEAKRAADYIYADGMLSMQDKSQYLNLLYESIKRFSVSSMPVVVAKQYDIMSGRQMTPLVTAKFVDAPSQPRDLHAISREKEYEKNKARFWTNNGSLIHIYQAGNFPCFKLALELYGVCGTCNTQDERITQARRAADYIHSDTQLPEQDKWKYLELLYRLIGLPSAIILQ